MPNSPDIVAEARELLASVDRNNRVGHALRLLKALCDEVERLRGGSADLVIQQIQIMQEKHPGQRIELSVEPDGYCYVTRSDGQGNVQPIAEGATLGDVFDAD